MCLCAEVMDEAILLRDDGLELCARVAQRREETGPPWAILAIWWFWVRAPGSSGYQTCQSNLETHKISE